MIESKEPQLGLRMTRFPTGTVFELFVTAAAEGKIRTRKLATAEFTPPPATTR